MLTVIGKAENLAGKRSDPHRSLSAASEATFVMDAHPKHGLALQDEASPVLLQAPNIYKANCSLKCSVVW
jgi:hypothetical protein